MSKIITITLSDEQIATIASIRSTRLDRTESEIIQLIIERGCFALAYRTKYNKVKYARAKQEMAEFRAYKANRSAVARALDTDDAEDANDGEDNA